MFMNIISQEQVETPNDTNATATPVTQQPDVSAVEIVPPGVKEVEDEVCEEDVTVDMPPPMEEIQIPLPAVQTDNDQVHDQLVCSKLSIRCRQKLLQVSDIHTGSTTWGVMW